jgi:hypothetical protein
MHVSCTCHLQYVAPTNLAYAITGLVYLTGGRLLEGIISGFKTPFYPADGPFSYVTHGLLLLPAA